MSTTNQTTHGHVASLKSYLGVFLALMVLTVTTVAVSYVDMGQANVAVALAIALFKATLVAMIFMNVRNSSSLTKLFVGAGLVWFCILMVLTFSDYLTRGWNYQAQPWEKREIQQNRHIQ